MRSHRTTLALATLVALLAIAPLITVAFMAADATSWFDSHNTRIATNSLLLVLFTGLGAILIGLPLAFLTTCISVRWQRFWLVLFASPLALPSYIGAFTLYFGTGSGGELQQLTSILVPRIEGLWGSVLVMSIYTYPFVMLNSRAALMGVNGNLLSAARSLGMSPLKALLTIALPLIRNGIAAGALLAALYALSDFGTPAILGFDTFTREIFVEYNAFGLGQAAMLSLQLMLVVGTLLYVESKYKGTKEQAGKPLQVDVATWVTVLLLILGILVVLLAIVAPLASFTLWLVRDGISEFDPALIWHSLQTGLFAALVAAVLALPIAHAAGLGKLGRAVERVTYFGFGVPGIVMGTALVYISLQLPSLYQTLSLLVLACSLRFLPLAVGSTRTALEKIDGNVHSAAKVLGASQREVFLRVTLPLTSKGIIAGIALVFLETMRELPATLMLAPPDFETLATYIWRVYEAGYFGNAAVPGLLLFLGSGLGLYLLFSGEDGLLAQK